MRVDPNQPMALSETVKFPPVWPAFNQSRLTATSLQFTSCSNAASIEENSFGGITGLSDMRIKQCNDLISLASGAFNDLHVTALTVTDCSSLDTIQVGAFSGLVAAGSATLSLINLPIASLPPNLLCGLTGFQLNLVNVALTDLVANQFGSFEGTGVSLTQMSSLSNVQEDAFQGVQLTLWCWRRQD